MARAFMSLLALLLAGSMALAQGTDPVKGILLTARSDLRDPNFGGSVVLVTNHGGHGPLGVILNRPTRVPVSRLFPDLEALAPVQDRVYFGGPVSGGAISFVFRADKKPDDAIPVVDGVYWSGNQELLRKLLARDKPMEGLQVFVGYSGWAPGQLEREIARGDWKLENATGEAIFSPRPQRAWPEHEPAGPEHRG